jgi:hypothetical protein
MRRSQRLAAGSLSLEQALEHVIGVWGKQATYCTTIRENVPGHKLLSRGQPCARIAHCRKM